MADSENIQPAETPDGGEAAGVTAAASQAEPRQPEPGIAAESSVAAEPGSSAGSGIAAAARSDEAKTALSGASVVDLKRIHSIKVLVQAVLGGINMSVSRLSELREGEVIPLETRIGDPIDILTNGQLIARGEIVVIEGPENKFGIQITSLEPQGNA